MSDFKNIFYDSSMAILHSSIIKEELENVLSYVHMRHRLDPNFEEDKGTLLAAEYVANELVYLLEQAIDMGRKPRDLISLYMEDAIDLIQESGLFSFNSDAGTKVDEKSFRHWLRFNSLLNGFNNKSELEVESISNKARSRVMYDLTSQLTVS